MQVTVYGTNKHTETYYFMVVVFIVVCSSSRVIAHDSIHRQSTQQAGLTSFFCFVRTVV